jgi:hypothetical protein
MICSSAKWNSDCSLFAMSSLDYCKVYRPSFKTGWRKPDYF